MTQIQGSSWQEILKTALRPEQPFGPIASEDLLNRRNRSFEVLYDNTNELHHRAGRDFPTFIIGRKGAGKTAFLVGAALTSDADVILVGSEEVYTEVEKLRQKVTNTVAPVFADTLSHVWGALLYHAAMLCAANSTKRRNPVDMRIIRNYLSHYGEIPTLRADQLMARVGAAMTQAVLTAPFDRTLREACESLRNDRGTYSDAKAALRRALLGPDGGNELYVVVDNLEDLHAHIGALKDTLAGLFRATRTLQYGLDRYPFHVRLAFPAELWRELREIAASPEKDFGSALTIKWTAAELLKLCGNRLRRYLDLYHPYAYVQLGLPREHDPRDGAAAAATLRSLLPRSPMVTGLGAEEMPEAYIMRHTQLLPRHLLQLLNAIFHRKTIEAHERRINQGNISVPMITPRDVLDGVYAAEHRIVEGLLASLPNAYKPVAGALEVLKNRIPNVVQCSDLHAAFNQSGISKRFHMSYNQFMEAALAIGAFGLVERRTDRYVVGQFSYTFTQSPNPIEGKDSVCVHPLFMYRLFDRQHIHRLREQKAPPVYPYGSLEGEHEYDF
jgi:hypothetical protein